MGPGIVVKRSDRIECHVLHSVVLILSFKVCLLCQISSQSCISQGNFYLVYISTISKKLSDKTERNDDDSHRGALTPRTHLKPDSTDDDLVGEGDADQVLRPLVRRKLHAVDPLEEIPFKCRRRGDCLVHPVSLVFDMYV